MVDSKISKSKIPKNVTIMDTYLIEDKVKRVDALVKIIVRAKGTGVEGVAPPGRYTAMIQSLSVGRTGFKSKNPGARVLRLEMRLIGTKQRIWMNLLFPEADELLARLSGGFEGTDEEKIREAMRRRSIWVIYYIPDNYKSITILEEVL